MLKSHYGKSGLKAIELGQGLDWKLCATGTPAPNDRIEFANHAVFLDTCPTVNSFLATYFINRGQTQDRWALKPHALKPFYRALSHWCIFVTDPAVYGWKDNTGSLPPLNVHITDVPMTAEQNEAVSERYRSLFVAEAGGITKRSHLSQIAKGIDGTDTNKYRAIRSMVDTWPDESTIVWCWFNKEQERLEREFPEAASIHGGTKDKDCERLLAEFKSGKRKMLITKPKVLGFGLNLQVCTRMVFSSLIDSYEAYYQCVKRANRYGATKPLNVHIPVIEIERPMVENVLRKSKRVEQDTAEQQRIFLELGGIKCYQD